MEPSEWEGSVGTKWAQEWRRTDRSFAGLTEQLLGYARAETFSHVLDIGCGAGELSLALGRSHPHAELLGIDISEDLIEAARWRGAHSPTVQFKVANAATWSSEDFKPDLLLSRHGVMFFPEPAAAFANLLRNAAPSARLIFSCFRSVEENPWAIGLNSVLPPGMAQMPQPMVPGPFAFADQVAVTAMLCEAGWSEIKFEAVDFAYIAGTGDDAIADAVSYFLKIGPAARAAAQMEAAERDAFLKRLEAFLENHLDRDLVALLAGAWIVTARAPAAP